LTKRPMGASDGEVVSRSHLARAPDTICVFSGEYIQ
jgi:hypothetical protein